uniref:protein EARLY FLOWERING 4-like n=1 Tax=Erigeron canadensis TaxID=72917 RepID=UPI001CB8DC18|nr:protein EARLY FLOWERING 4-like [Erigeron canadensis]
MTTLDSASPSSAADSTAMVDESSNHHHQPPQQPFSDQQNNPNNKESEVVWTTFTDSFREVQTVLDRNRVLIQQVNENHRSKIHENMVNNVALIQEINNNVSKIVALYADLSTNFSSLFHQRGSETDGG